jgi:hypothetical protein
MLGRFSLVGGTRSLDLQLAIPVRVQLGQGLDSLPGRESTSGCDTSILVSQPAKDINRPIHLCDPPQTHAYGTRRGQKVVYFGSRVQKVVYFS